MKPISSFFNRLACEHPWKSLGVGFLLIVLMASGMRHLTTDFGYRIWFRESDPKLAVFDAFERTFGSDELAVVVLHSPSGIFDLTTAQTLIELTDALWQTPEAIRVDSLSNFQWVHAAGDDLTVEPLVPDDLPLTEALLNARKKVALAHRSVSGYLISEDAKTTLIFVRLKPGIDQAPDYETVAKGISKIVDPFRGQSDHEFYITGNPILNYSFQESSQRDFNTLVPIVVGLTIFFLALNFRRVSGVTMPMLVIITTILVTMGFGGMLRITISNLTAIIPQFMIAIAVAISVHILVTFFQFFNRGIEKYEAIQLTIQKNLRPTFLTSLSTAIGFYSFTTAQVPPIAHMGLMAGTGTLLSWVISYVVLLPLISILPLKPKIRADIDHDVKILEPSGFSKRFSNLLFTNRRRIMIGYGAFVLFAIFMVFRITVNSDPFKYFDEKYPMRVANEFVEENVGGAIGAEIVIDSGEPEGIKDPEFMAKVGEFQDWINQYPFVSKTVSIVDILKEMNKALNGGKESAYRLPDTRDGIAQQLFLYTMSLPQGLDVNDRVSIQNDAVRLTAMWTLHESKIVVKTITEIEEKAKQMGLKAQVTGKFPLYQTMNKTVVVSFVTSLSIAILLIGVLLCVGLRSIRIGLLSLIPNAIPLIIGGGSLSLIGQPLDIGTVLVGSVCLGIAVDDTIHFLSNFQKYVAAGDSAELAVSKVVTYTGPALAITTMVLVVAFATFAFGTFVPNQNFGKFVALILSFALVTDFTFLPAMVMSMKWPGQQSANR